MRVRIKPALSALLLTLCAPADSMAAASMLSGMFDGAEPKTAPLPGNPCEVPALGFRQVSFSVTAAGEYLFFDAFRALEYVGAPPVAVSIYAGPFDPAHPMRNLVAAETEPWLPPRTRLEPGEDYFLVVQHDCRPAEGAWAVAFNGPGQVRSGQAVQVPAFSAGAFRESDPTMTRMACGDIGRPARYRQSGPVRVARSGTYYFSEPLFDIALTPICLNIYSAPPNRSNPLVNLIASFASYDTVDLEAGRDYYFVVQPYWGLGSGEYQFVLAPPAPFRINRGLADAWHNPQTPGQGFFLDVFDSRNAVFLGWLTYHADPRPGAVADQAWMTAYGPFAGTQAELGLQWTLRPAAAANGVPEQRLEGKLQLDFFDCSSGLLRYAWGTTASGEPVRQGIIPIQRIRNDSVALCETLYAGPAAPGPL